MFLTQLGKFKDFGLLVARLGVGFMFAYAHGMGKIMGGPALWGKIGKSMGYVGIDFFPVFWGFMAAFSEFFGGILVAIGLLCRPATALLLITMIVAACSHFGRGDSLGDASHAIENAFFLVALLFTGPGRFSVDAKLGKA